MTNGSKIDGSELAELLLNSTGEGIYGVDLDGNCTFANPACVRILGFESGDELLGRNMHDLVHHTLPNGDPYPMADCQIYRAFQEGNGVHIDTEVMWKADGSRFHAEYWSYPVEQDNQPIGSVLTFVDITERRRLERQLRTEHERAERLLLNVLPAKIAAQLIAQPGKTNTPGSTVAGVCCVQGTPPPQRRLTQPSRYITYCQLSSPGRDLA
jgi:PAS domain S-box-containing protein